MTDCYAKDGDAGQTCPCDVRAGDFDVFRIRFQRDQASLRWQRSCKPDRAVSAKRADFEDRFRAAKSCRWPSVDGVCGTAGTGMGPGKYRSRVHL